MTRVSFHVDGEPVPWARARQSGRRHFTDPRVKNKKNAVAIAARAAGVVVLAPGVPVTLRLTFAFEGEGMFHTQRPDVDNLAKLVLDALTGVAYRDDVQVCSVIAHKVWAATPYTLVEVES